MIIYKYPLITGFHGAETIINVPVNSEFLDIALQDDIVNVWFEVDVDCEEPTKEKTFVAMHTGALFDLVNLEYKKTIVENKRYVVHIYEKIPIPFLDRNEFSV